MKQKERLQQRRQDILYEDRHILLVNKPAGVIVHPNDSQQTEMLLNYVRDYLRRTGAWNADVSTAFRPMPCNRLDRFTSGIAIFASDKSTTGRNRISSSWRYEVRGQMV